MLLAFLLLLFSFFRSFFPLLLLPVSFFSNTLSSNITPKQNKQTKKKPPIHTIAHLLSRVVLTHGTTTSASTSSTGPNLNVRPLTLIESTTSRHVLHGGAVPGPKQCTLGRYGVTRNARFPPSPSPLDTPPIDGLPCTQMVRRVRACAFSRDGVMVSEVARALCDMSIAQKASAKEGVSWRWVVKEGRGERGNGERTA